MVSFRRSRFLCCVLILLLNVALQLFLSILFGFMNLPYSESDRSISPLNKHDCQCPSVPERPVQEHTDIPTCGSPPSPKSDNTAAHADNLNRAPNSDKNYLLVVIVLSSIGGVDRRNAIRDTWMEGYRNRDPPILVKFAIGTENLESSDHIALLSEEKEYKDLLLLPYLQESYFNLTRKVLHSFIHLYHNISFTYLMKCDDDTFIVLDTLLKELAERPSLRRSYYWGFFNGKANIKRKGKWKEESWFLCDYYLPYALGGGYILSRDLVGRIVTAADGLQFYNSEDVSVGVWLSPYKAERKHDVRFNTEFVSRGCRNMYMVSHKQSVEEMRKKHSLLKERGVQCEKEYQTRLSYEYNWDVDPSKCCERKKGVP